MRRTQILALENRLIENRNSGKISLALYLTLGYPSFEKSLKLMEEIGNKIDILEIGIPFSDPMADGPVIQHTGNVALKNGVTPDMLWEALDRLSDISASKIVMTYGNILYKQGFDNFAIRASKNGVDGVIIPDIPFEHIPPSIEKIRPIYLFSPNMSEERLRLLAQKTNGYAYILSKLGVTGGSYQTNTNHLQKLYTFFKEYYPDLPLMQGFGINSIGSIKHAIKSGADGVIIGSHILELFGAGGSRTRVNDFVDKILSCSIT